ncbi:metalloregulator ArsR/SmtB family transcription factor [Nonomuraea sp. NPDC046570]|uniref:ArsR/SmtB family transcription factor n=1 Tax=Nonomuraea sp. NPDC046570 TaxID=3155255 RepID=UPI0033C43E4C
MDETLRAIADPTRRAILMLVRDREISAGDIAAHFPAISRPAVSQHLRILVTAGLIQVRREGNRRFYRLRPHGLTEAAAFFETMWSAPLQRLKQAAEHEQHTPATAEEEPTEPC